MTTPKVTIVIPNWNTKSWLQGCLDGLAAQTFQDFSIVLVDNGSTDDSVNFVKINYPNVDILPFEENRGFAPAVNAGIYRSRSEYVVLLNVDTVPQPTWLESLVETIDHSLPEVGCVASKMLSMQNPDIIDDAGNTLSWYGSAHKRGNGQSASLYMEAEEVFSASGGATLYRRSFLETLGGFDENFVTYLEDVDLGLRGRLLGYHCVYAPTAQILHQWGGAGIPRPKYVYYSTRNRLALLVKSIPISLLLKYSPQLLYGQFYYLVVYKKPFYSMAGILAFFISLPRILHERSKIQKDKVISNENLEGMLTTDLGSPGIWDIIKQKWLS